jgi:hypothetical protein
MEQDFGLAQNLKQDNNRNIGGLRRSRKQKKEKSMTTTFEDLLYFQEIRCSVFCLLLFNII